MKLCLFSDFAKTANGASDGDRGRGRVGPRTAGDRFTASFAVPNSNDLSLQCVLAAKGAGVGGVLRHLHLLDGLSERRTVTRRILSGDSDFLGTLRHF